MVWTFYGMTGYSDLQKEFYYSVRYLFCIVTAVYETRLYLGITELGLKFLYWLP